MKTTTPAVLNTITNDHANTVGTVVRAEWKHNRFYRTLVDNTPSEDTDGYDIEFFPIESITKPNRPKAGICKAIVGQALVEPEYHDTVPAARYYTVDADDEYKYWQSPLSASSSSPFNISNCAPQVTYVQEGADTAITVKANKVYFTVENTFAYPDVYDVQVKYTTGGSWTTIKSNVAIPVGGKVELWYDGAAWNTTPNYSSTIDISAVRLVVTSMNREAYFNLIELGVGLELDLTADVANWSDTFTMGDDDFITPLGTISSNSGSITLFNDAGTYTNTNVNSPLYGLLDKGVTLRGWMKYGTDLVREFEMFSDTWSEGESDVTVSMTDGSKFFMDTIPRAVIYQNIPVQEVVWRICDIIGFNNYNITAIDNKPHSIIDIFWTNGDKTAWEIFSDLSRSSQTAIYFDSYGTLQVKTRDAAWNSAQTPVYNFIRNSIPGGQPANIVSLNEEDQYEANKVTINWKPTGFSQRVDNVVPFEVVWEPDSDVVLRSTELAQNLLVNDTTLSLPTKEGKTWPWNGMAQIEGEWISFDAKWYVYYDASGNRQTKWVESFAEQQRLDSDTPPSMGHLNTYTGNLRIKERGLYNTEAVSHYNDMSGWTKARQRNYGATTSPASGISLNVGESSVTLESPSDSDMDDYTYLYRGNTIDQGYYYIGTRLKIDKTSHKDKVGGMFFNSDTSLGSGYFLEVMATARFDGAMRKISNEVRLYSMMADGSKKVFGGEKLVIKDKSKNSNDGGTIKKDIGAEMDVTMGTYIDFDVWYTPGSPDKFKVWANGQLLFETTVPGGWQHSRVSRAGLYARGNSSVTFDYFYAINNLGVDPIDGESYYDNIDNAYRGNQIMRDWTYEERKARRRVKKKWTKYKQKYNQRFYDEFGPMVHEVREYNVKFTSDTPVLESRLYFSNHSQALVTEYVGDVMGAHWIIANASRSDAIVFGDDETTSKGNGTINQKMFVYGRPAIQKDAQQTVKTDDWAIRRRGIIDVEYDSDWIQNEEQAEAFGTWLTTHWSASDSKVDMEVFGNPLIELSDVVTVTYKNIHSVFYVIGVNNNFDQGLTTTLTLRKAYNL